MPAPRRQTPRQREGNDIEHGLMGALLPVQLGQTIPFEPIRIQTSVLEAQTLEIMPVTAISNPLTMIEFIARPQDYYLDLSSVVLKLKCEVTKEDGTDLPVDDTKSGVVNNLPASIINRVEVYLNEKAVQLCSDNYSLRSYLEMLLNYDDASAKTKLQTNIFSKDTAGKGEKATAENTGWIERRKKIHKTGVGSLETTMLHRLHLDVSSCSEYFINGLTLRIRILLHEPTFYMFNADDTEKTKLKITAASLLLKTKVITPEVVLQNEARLATTNARYVMRRADIRTFVTPGSGRKISLPNVWLGPQPHFFALCLLKSDNFAGTRLTNPFIFYHQTVSTVSVYLNNNAIVLGPVESDDYAGYVPFYHQFIESLSLQGNNNVMISYDEFINGFFIVAFDMSADKNAAAGSHISMSMTGSLRVEIELTSPLTENMVVACFGLFSSVLEVSKDRVVSVE